MKFYTSSFYNIRFFKPWEIPVSTALWDPKWFHEGLGKDHTWISTNGVWMGLRAECLNPGSCHACGCPCQSKNPSQCSFIKSYREGLDAINFPELLETLTGMAEFIKGQSGFIEEPSIILIVYEAENNPCSERNSIQDLFRKHNIPIEEWKKNYSA